MNKLEAEIINFLGKNGNFFKNKENKKDKINYENTEIMINRELKAGHSDISKALSSLERKSILILYFDSAYIQLSSIGEKIFNEQNN